ncbi:MAG: S8 family peptidase, partial [Paludibacter sp.]|nr:S8 family peptidase [Paludibacter sp.]
KSKLIELVVDSSAYFIQTKEQNAITRKISLESFKKSGEIISFTQVAKNRFIIFGNDKKLENDDYISYIYKNGKQDKIIILPRIVLTLKTGQTIYPIFNKYSEQISIEKSYGSKVLLKCFLNNSESVLRLIKDLNNMNEIEWCEPEMLSDFKTNNPLYPQQYYLRNTGQNGGTSSIDINVEPAWNITNGAINITVAVIDEGVDRNHEDMGNRVLEGFTIRNQNGFGAPQNAGTTVMTCKGHGVACAGIIAASNNTIGIRGVANNIRILPVNIVPDPVAFDMWGNIISGGFGSNIEIAQAINWAWHRADVLSCSWGGGMPSNDITLAIDSARGFGRNGKGCPVVFASGNGCGNPGVTDVAFPGNVNNVITVGSINNQGMIWNYSQRGAAMDLVAPSGNVNFNGDVRTTDRMGDIGYNNTNYMTNFGGTSAACPQVAGVAALMLSVRPDLTETQVRTTLQNTARDLGSTGFDNTYGYGLVNAYAAVNTVAPHISGPSHIYNQGTYTITNLPTGATVQWSTLIPDYATITGQGTSTATFNFYRGLDGHDDVIKASIFVNGVLIKELELSVFVGLGVSSIESLEYCGYNVLIAHATEDDNPNPNLTCTWTCNDGQFVYFPYGDDASFADKGSRVTAIQVAQSGYYTVCATLNDGTYTSPQFCSSVYINANGSYSAFSLYPNPATSSVTLSLLDTDMVAKNTSQQENALNSSSNIQTVNGLLNKYEIQLWNSTGLVKRIITDQPQYQMSLNGVSKGFYYVVVIRNGKTYRQQLVVNKN